MAILKFKKLIEDLEGNTSQVVSAVTKTTSIATSAAYSGTAQKAATAAVAGTSYYATTALRAGTASGTGAP